MGEIEAVIETGIYVDDLDQAGGFYRDVLGMDIVFNFTRNGAWYGFYLGANGRSHVEVFLKPEAEYTAMNQINGTMPP